jgi:hypothetical protein
MPDREVIQRLAAEVAEIAALPAHEETRALWRASNALRPERPMVMIDQIPWHEMNVEDELTLLCESELARSIETGLRRTIYRWRHMPADYVVEPYVYVSKVIEGTSLDVRPLEERAALDPANDVVGHIYLDQLKTDEDLEKLRAPEVRLDAAATAAREAEARELLGDTLEVRMQGPHPTFAFWDRLSEWHGVEASLYDLVDRPDFVHRMIGRITAAYHSMLDQLEEQGLLGHPMEWIHCTGGYADELPAAGFDRERVRARDLWTFGMAQVFSSVSPEMHREFETEYQIPWFKRFGLGYYGCCEPLDRKIDQIRTIPNVRKISMSPWANIDRGAEAIAGDFVFSRKPSPALLATDAMDWDEVRRDLTDTRDACRTHGCPLEYVLKDISTVRYEPHRLWEWSRIALEVARG